MGLDDDDDGWSSVTSLSPSERPSYGTLQEWLGTDTKAVEAQEDYLRLLQLTPTQRITESDRRKLKNWDFSVLNVCKEHIESLLSTPIPTFEEERIRRAIRQLAVSADVLAQNAIELAEKLDQELGPLDGDLDDEEDSSSVVAPPLPHENSAHDQASRDFESPAARRLSEDPARAAADVVVAAVGKAAPAEISERGGRASSTSSETDSEEDATRRWEACVGRGPSAPVLRVGRR